MASLFRSRLWILDLFFTLCIVLLLASGIVMTKKFEEVRYNQFWVQHTHEVMIEINGIYFAAKEAESAVRSYILTQNQETLESYQHSKIDIFTHFNKVQNLTVDNPVQTQNCKDLIVLLQNRTETFEALITKSQKDSNSKSRGQMAKADAMGSIEAIKSLILTMTQEEQRLREIREEKNQESANQFEVTLCAIGALIIVALSVGFYYSRRFQIQTVEESKKREKEAWRKSVLADVAKLVTGDINPEVASHRVLNYLARQLQVCAGNFYVLKDGGLQLVTSFGLEKQETDSKNQKAPGRLELTSGSPSLLLEAFQQKNASELKNLPADYLWISSSLGRAAPTSLLFLPVAFLGSNVGIFELASLTDWNAELIVLLETVAETIGAGINSANSRERLQELLEETQQQSEELQTQQEELRTTNEELEQQARALESQQRVLNQRNQDLDLAKRDSDLKAVDLEKVNLYKSEFLAKMSHELRTPLNSLLILTTLLIENKEKNLTAQQTEFAKTIQNAGNDLLNLINDILDLSKIEAKKLALNPELFTIGSLVDHVRGMFEIQVKSKGLQLEVVASEGIKAEEIYTDRQRLEQILRNFLSNAIKFTEVGFIRLQLSRPTDATLEIAVEDSGVGIPENKLQKIFEAFEQADGSVSRKYGGTGLGLTISRELAQLLKGRIELKSEDGKGSRFSLILPVRLADQTNAEKNENSDERSELQKSDREFIQATKEKTSRMKTSLTDEAQLANQFLNLAKKSGDKKEILIVEDDADFCSLIKDAAAGYNFTVLTAPDGETALEMLKTQTPDAIMLDIKLPGVSGMGVLELIKNMPHLRHVPIHMMSALEYQQSALRMGAAGYLAKPVKLENLRAALSRLESLISKRVKRLLIIEDDIPQRESMMHLIGTEELEIVTAGTGKAAMDLIQTTSFDCVILDLTLPDMTGVDLLGKLSALQISLPPIVVYTAKDLSPQEENYLRQHAESIIIKGVKSPERLLDEVNLFLHRIENVLPADRQQMLSQLRGQRQSLQGKTVLLVDDDLRNIFALTSALEDKGLNVRVGRNGYEALEQLEMHKDISIVLMDLMMPKMDGLEAIRRIRAIKEFKQLPIVALTAKAMKGDQEQCIQAGANDYLPKPIEMTNLISILNVWLAKRNIF